MNDNQTSQDVVKELDDVAADAQLVGYQSPAQNALLRGASEIKFLRAQLWTLAELIFHNASSDDGKHWARRITVTIKRDEPPTFAIAPVETSGAGGVGSCSEHTSVIFTASQGCPMCQAEIRPLEPAAPPASAEGCTTCGGGGWIGCECPACTPEKAIGERCNHLILTQRCQLPKGHDGGHEWVAESET
jgi:hypothetical protein